MKGVAPKSIGREVADPVSQRGRQNPQRRQRRDAADASGVLDLQHVAKWFCVNAGGPVGSAQAVEPNKPLKQGWLDDSPGVGLADSTLRQGEPATWGSGQQ